MYVSMMFTLCICVAWHLTDTSPTVGRLSVVCRPTDSLCFGENLLAVCWATNGRQSANSWPTDGRQSADRRPTISQQTADSRPTDGRQSADRFFGELFFTITEVLTSKYTNICFEFQGELYCVSCHTRLFGTKGYGYGVGSGVLSTDTGTAGEAVSTAPKTAPVNTGGPGTGKSCPRCNRVVYDAEKIRAVGKVN